MNCASVLRIDSCAVLLSIENRPINDMNMPTVGIVTVTYNSGSFLQEFAESCAAQSGVKYTVYCVDNKSTDETVEMLKTIADDRWRLELNDANVGVSAGNNQGILQALSDDCDWIVLLNNDTRFEAMFLERLIEAAVQYGWKAVVPKIHYDTPAGCIWYAGGGFNRFKGFTGFHSCMGHVDRGQCDIAHTVDYAPTCAMLVHKDVFLRVGLMDEAYFVYFDDTDFCWRLKESGVLLGYCPEVKLIHKVGGSTGGAKSAFSAFFVSRNRIYFLRKHFGVFVACAWVPLFLSVYVFRYIRGWWDYKCLVASIRGTFSSRKMKSTVPTPPGPEQRAS